MTCPKCEQTKKDFEKLSLTERQMQRGTAIQCSDIAMTFGCMKASNEIDRVFRVDKEDQRETTADEIRDAVKSLYRAREARSAARRRFKEAHYRIGMCDGNNSEGGPCYYDLALDDDPCDVCKEKQPLWEDSRKKGIRAGAALRAVILIGKKISEGRR